MTDDTTPRDLPPAFDADEPPSDDKHGQFGAGRLVGSAVPEEVREARRRDSEDTTQSGEQGSRVDEASKESFPGSDPPSHGRQTSIE